MNTLGDPEVSRFMPHAAQSLLDTSPSGIAKMAVSLIAGVLAFHFLRTGKRDQNVNAMVWGLILAVVSIFAFW